MPLIKSKTKKAFRSNVRALMGEVGKSDNVRSPEQALAIAYAIKRRARAMGGRTFAGPILSRVPGRTDNHPMDVASGSYVLPADHVSSLGEGNTVAGMEYLKKIGPQGIKRISGGPKLPKVPRSGKRRFANGGGLDTAGQPVPINAAGGEYVIPPDEVVIIGDGDLKRGHAILDAWVLNNRKSHIKTLRKLPGPAQD